jgi:hypothetical protein
MDPYAILGIPANSTIAEAKAAWRKMARKHHPDVGGNEAKFKIAKEAWEDIESGRVNKPSPTPNPAPSSFSQPTPSSFTQGIHPKTVNKPYSTPSRIHMPNTTSIKGKHNSYALDITVTHAQAERGCVVPFIHAGSVHDYVVRPGSVARTHAASMVLDNTIGKFPPDKVELIVNLFING